MLSKFLLGGAALGAITAAAALAYADTLGSGEDLSVKISGKYRFNVGLVDQDVSSGFGRGYPMQSRNGFIFSVRTAHDASSV